MHLAASSLRIAPTAFLVALGTAAGCAGRAERDEPLPPPGTAIEECRRYREATCRRYMECLPPEQGGPASLGECLDHLDEPTGTCAEEIDELSECTDGVAGTFQWCTAELVPDWQCEEICTPSGDRPGSCFTYCPFLCDDDDEA